MHFAEFNRGPFPPEAVAAAIGSRALRARILQGWPKEEVEIQEGEEQGAAIVKLNLRAVRWEGERGERSVRC